MTRNKRPKRLTVEKLAANCLDVRELNRAGAFLEGRRSFPWAGLTWPGVAKMVTDPFRMELLLDGRSVPQTIRLSWTRCNYGGRRPWFLCPYCQRRVARLFRGLVGYFCLNCFETAVYESQRRSKKARNYLRAYRLRQRLGGSRPVLDPIPARPYGMRRRTHTRLAHEIERLERPLHGSRVVRRAPDWIRPLSY